MVRAGADDRPGRVTDRLYQILERYAEDEPEWRQGGACRGLDPALFYPEVGESTAPAVRVCRACEVRQECLDYAIKASERFGVWGGLSEKERRVERRRRAGGDFAAAELHAQTREREIRAKRAWRERGGDDGYAAEWRERQEAR